MSIRPPFAEGLLDGSKRVEFRKRRLAPDVTTVLIYATMPVGRIVGAFEVDGYDVGSPTSLWERHKSHAGVSRAAFRQYFAGRRQAIGILVRDARRLHHPILLGELDASLRPPQSFCYLQLAPWGSDEPAEALVARINTLGRSPSPLRAPVLASSGSRR